VCARPRPRARERDPLSPSARLFLPSVSSSTKHLEKKERGGSKNDFAVP
jgi:hypothetical protein